MPTSAPSMTPSGTSDPIPRRPRRRSPRLNEAYRAMSGSVRVIDGKRATVTIRGVSGPRASKKCCPTAHWSARCQGWVTCVKPCVLGEECQARKNLRERRVLGVQSIIARSDVRDAGRNIDELVEGHRLPSHALGEREKSHHRDEKKMVSPRHQEAAAKLATGRLPDIGISGVIDELDLRSEGRSQPPWAYEPPRQKLAEGAELPAQRTGVVQPAPGPLATRRPPTRR